CSDRCWPGPSMTASPSNVAAIRGDRRFPKADGRTISQPSLSASSFFLRSASCSTRWWWGGTSSAHPHLEPDMSIHSTQSPSAQNQPAHKRITAPDIRARKGLTPIVVLTSYHAHTARILDAHCDVILVGDSLGMVMHGLETTIPVTLDMMILQGHAVM